MSKNKSTFLRTFSKLALSVLLIALLSLASPGVARAATITVNSTADNTTAGDGNCTLREAIANGDSDTTSGDCTAGSGDDTITFAPGIAGGTITLGGTELTISSNLTITGPSAGMTIDGNNASCVFNISSGTVEMSSLTITNGNGTGSGPGAGGIRNLGTLTLNSVTVSNNTVSGFGGGIISANTLTLNNSTISGNTSGSGGGGIADQDSTNIINNSTIYNNSTTAAGGGGGLDMFGSSSTTNIKNSILAGNSNGSGANNVVTSGGATVTSQGYNLESGTDAGFTEPTDLQNTDPKLLALADNGGPTQTHALDNGSPALEQIPFGTNGCGTTYTTDQRGYARPGTKNQPTNKCEMGAWEAQTGDPTAITLRGFSARSAGGGMAFPGPVALAAVFVVGLLAVILHLRSAQTIRAKGGQRES